MSRLWFWLLGSALFLLVGLQLMISWIVARVLEVLAKREELANRDLQESAPCRETAVESAAVPVFAASKGLK